MLKKRSELLVFSQVIIIVLAIFSFSFIISEVSFVYGQDEPTAASRLAEESTGIKGPAGGPGGGPTTVPKTTTPTGTKTSGSFLSELYGGELFGAEVGTFGSALIQGVAWGGTVYLALTLLTSLLGVEEGLADAISAAGGIFSS